jgi:hypothetical protein
MATTYKVVGQVNTGPILSNTISNKALTSNIATLTTGTAHGFAAGDRVVVTGVDTTFNGTFAVASIPTSTTFTFPLTASNVTSAAVTTGTVTAYDAPVSLAVTNKAKSGGFATLTTASHTLAAGDDVYVYINDTTIDGTRTLSSVTSTTMTFIAVGADIASTAVSSGGVSGNTWQTLYTVPSATQTVVSTIQIVNVSDTTANADIILAVAGAAFDVKQFVAKDIVVDPSETVFITVGMALGAADVLKVRSTPGVSFTAYGSEVA